MNQDAIRALRLAFDYSAGEDDFEDVLACIASQDYRFWHFKEPELYVVTRVIVFKNFSRVHIYLASGTYDDKHMRAVEEYAKSIGCKGVQWTGRLGWKKRVESMGYKPQYITMVKDEL